LRSRASGAPALVIAAALVSTACDGRPAAFDEPPNLLLIVVDTLRADHLPFHGYERDTAPKLTERMARGGVVFENAYAPAAWTSPSIAALLTGRDPVELVPGADLRAFGIPDGERTVALRLRSAGYQTAAFVGNMLIHEGAGFSRGFQRFWVIPGGYDSITRSAEAVLEPALGWLESEHQPDRPFFLYVHFMDPHDPYVNPGLNDGRSEFYPDYDGPIRGTDVHPLNEGTKQLSDDPASDIRHLSALYDAEILWVDEAVAALIDQVEAVSTRPTLVAFTSDHGEELHEHGGWTHGRTLYEEIVHIPLAFRSAESIPAGRRLAGNVSLLDVAPTLLAAAGAPADDLEGIDLLPFLFDAARSLPRRPLFVRHWQRGPLRAMLLVDRRKLLLFNHRQPFASGTRLERHLASADLARLPRMAAFDLTADPHEIRPLPPSADEVESAYSRLDPTLDGLRVVLRGVDEGTTVAGSLRFAAEPSGTLPLFLADLDEVRVDGRTVSFRLAGEAPPKGFLVLGDLGPLESVEIDPGVDVAIECGNGDPWNGTPVDAATMRSDGWPPWTGRANLRIWSRDSRATDPGRPLDGETRARLRALGYL
jgi:arylsulfatase A-like enzyme